MAAAGSTVEFDFFRIEKETSFAEPSMKVLDRKRSFRDIQGLISKIKPEIVKAVIASGSANAVSPNAAKKHQNFSSPSITHCNPITCSYGQQNGVETAPMTIFYNGAVVVYDVPHQQAQNILRVAETAAESNPDMDPNDACLQQEGMPRKKSLRRFFEKRKERQINMGLSHSQDGGI